MNFCDALIKTYAAGVTLYSFPGSLNTEGHSGLKSNYASLFKNTIDLNFSITKRIVMDNVVIDQEVVFANGTIFKAVAIYEVENGRITKVDFIQ